MQITFRGCVPWSPPRQQIAAILGISERNDFAMLERIGGECAGAVSLLSEDAPPPTVGEMRVRELIERELEDIVAELPRRPLLAGHEGLRLSLAGAQSKLPVLIRNAAIALPLGNTPSTHIIKPEPERFHREDHASALADPFATSDKPVGEPTVTVALFPKELAADVADQNADPEDELPRSHRPNTTVSMGSGLRPSILSALICVHPRLIPLLPTPEQSTAEKKTEETCIDEEHPLQYCLPYHLGGLL